MSCNVTLNESNGDFQSTLITIPSIGNINLPVIFFRVIAPNSLTNRIDGGLNSALFVLYDNTMDTTGHSQSWAETIACYLSRSTNQWNAGGECCYDSSDQLMTRGTDNRYRPSTSPIRHFFSDTLSYLVCCSLNSDIEVCERYFNSRPHRRGSNSPNGGGGTCGDPHFITLDGTSYIFNGHGEYTYLAITDSPTSINTPFDSSIQNLIFNSQF